jgi:hypothetical protein
VLFFSFEETFLELQHYLGVPFKDFFLNLCSFSFELLFFSLFILSKAKVTIL